MLHVQDGPNLVLALPVQKWVDQWEGICVNVGAVVEPSVVDNHAPLAWYLLGDDEGGTAPVGCAWFEPAPRDELFDQFSYGGLALAHEPEGSLNPEVARWEGG